MCWQPPAIKQTFEPRYWDCLWSLQFSWKITFNTTRTTEHLASYFVSVRHVDSRHEQTLVTRWDGWSFLSKGDKTLQNNVRPQMCQAQAQLTSANLVVCFVNRIIDIWFRSTMGITYNSLTHPLWNGSRPRLRRPWGSCQTRNYYKSELCRLHWCIGNANSQRTNTTPHPSHPQSARRGSVPRRQSRGHSRKWKVLG